MIPECRYQVIGDRSKTCDAAYDSFADDVDFTQTDRNRRPWTWRSVGKYLAMVVCTIAGIHVLLNASLLFKSCLNLGHHSTPTNQGHKPLEDSKVPDYFQTSDTKWAGPTETGEPPFLAETNPAPFPGTTFIPVSPLETQVPIAGNDKNGNIFQLHGQLSHYFSNPEGFGVDEYSLPPGSNITHLHMIHRHGSRYPHTDGGGSGIYEFGQKLQNMSKSLNTTGDLEFLNYYQFLLGTDILVPVGKQELFDSGTLHYYQYGHLYPNNGSKIIVRTTTMDRMLQSAEYFLAGFFGLSWTKNATLEVIIESEGFNNTLAGFEKCEKSRTNHTRQGDLAANEWAEIYLKDATARFQDMTHGGGLTWTASDLLNVQQLCAYETVALGFSHFCGLFTYAEWQGFEYALDITFSGVSGFQSPVGRALGIGYVQEVLARLEHHVISSPLAQVNVTLDNNTATFPLDQALNLDFSHDSTILAVLTGFGLTQFNTFLPPTEIVSHENILSHMVPFAARLDIEVIEAPQPVSPKRTGGARYLSGSSTRYIHFILNQRTIPLGKSFQECGDRDDGWCELETFLQVQKKSFALADYEYACYGSYPVLPYGAIKNGAPLQKADSLESIR